MSLYTSQKETTKLHKRNTTKLPLFAADEDSAAYTFFLRSSVRVLYVDVQL